MGSSKLGMARRWEGDSHHSATCSNTEITHLVSTSSSTPYDIHISTYKKVIDKRQFNDPGIKMILFEVFSWTNEGTGLQISFQIILELIILWNVNKQHLLRLNFFLEWLRVSADGRSAGDTNSPLPCSMAFISLHKYFCILKILNCWIKVVLN